MSIKKEILYDSQQTFVSKAIKKVYRSKLKKRKITFYSTEFLNILGQTFYMK